jgi:hypothetical protein
VLDLDDDALVATVDLVGRTGARGLQFGYLNDDVPIDQADWWAHAEYKGTRISVEHHAGPLEALDALARRLLTGARCKCGKLVALSDQGAVAFNCHLVDGTRWTSEQAAAAGQCRWRRLGPKWERGCASDNGTPANRP